MTKKCCILFSTLMFAVLMVSIPSGVTAASTKPVKLKMAHGWSTKHHIHAHLDQWAKDVEKATDERVKIQIFPGGALSTAKQLYDTAKLGVVDLVWFIQGYTPGKFPLTSVIELPFMTTSAVQGSLALWDLYETSPEMQAEYKGVKILSLWTVDAGQLMTTRKVVRNVEDIKGLKLRIGSDTLKPTAEALGSVPILMGIGELFDAMQKGVVDGTLLGTSAIRTFKLADIMKGLTIGNFFVNAQAMGINERSWKKISPEDQKIIQDLSGSRLAQIMADSYDKEAEVGLSDAKAAKVEIVPMPDPEMAKWKKAVSGIYQDWIADMKSKGLPGQEFYDKTNELIKKYE